MPSCTAPLEPWAREPLFDVSSRTGGAVLVVLLSLRAGAAALERASAIASTTSQCVVVSPPPLSSWTAGIGVAAGAMLPPPTEAELAELSRARFRSVCAELGSMPVDWVVALEGVHLRARRLLRDRDYQAILLGASGAITTRRAGRLARRLEQFAPVEVVHPLSRVSMSLDLPYREVQGHETVVEGVEGRPWADPRRAT